LLKDAYKFYKNSSKRKKGLESTTPRRHKEVDEFVDKMLQEVAQGKEELEKRPSLRLQCWNATRWLGRSTCLIALCKAYEYILEHLTEFVATKTEMAEHKAQATALYVRLTSYDAFLFIHMYRDLAGTMARTTKFLQNRDIRIRDVGRAIMRLCQKLKGNYPEGSDVPTALLGDGTTDTVMQELFGKNGTFPIAFSRLIFRYS
jgi:hypothetical protein